MFFFINYVLCWSRENIMVCFCSGGGLRVRNVSKQIVIYANHMILIFVVVVNSDLIYLHIFILIYIFLSSEQLQKCSNLNWVGTKKKKIVCGGSEYWNQVKLTEKNKIWSKAILYK